MFVIENVANSTSSYMDLWSTSFVTHTNVLFEQISYFTVPGNTKGGRHLDNEETTARSTNFAYYFLGHLIAGCPFS